MKLEITDAIDKGDKIVLEMQYDWEFAAAVLILSSLFGGIFKYSKR